MIAKLLPIVIVLAGAGAGVGAGIALRPEAKGVPEAHGLDGISAPCGDVAHAAPDHAEADKDDAHGDGPATTDFVRMPEQFVIPVIDGERVASLVVMGLSIEVRPDGKDAVLTRMPKLRDGFLRVMLDHANRGGFDGAFTSNGSMETLRTQFMETATSQIGPSIRDVLILDINRQDVG